MAFATASGYGNLPNGNFSPVIYSKSTACFRKSTVVEILLTLIISVRLLHKVIKEPEISVNSYSRGTNVTAQDLDDEDFSLTIDKANYFAFKMDDIEEAHSHVNFMDLATNRAAYRLADNHDQEVLGYMAGYEQACQHANANALNTSVNGTKAVTTAGSNELLSSMQLHKVTLVTSLHLCRHHSIPLTARMPGATSPTASPAIVARMARLLDQQQVDTQGRWLVVDPVFMEILADEDSRFMNADFGESGGLRNGLSLTTSTVSVCTLHLTYQQ